MCQLIVKLIVRRYGKTVKLIVKQARWSTCHLPTKFAVVVIVLDAFQCEYNVWNHVFWKVLLVKPIEMIASVRLCIAGFAGPIFGSQKKVDLFFVVIPAVHDVNCFQMLFHNYDAGFLFGFTNHGAVGPFVAINMAGHHAVISVFISRVEPAQEEQFAVFFKE